jgi:hypothetical protein
MSLGYAHLAPDQRREAVAKLDEKPLLALTMRLQWEGSSAVGCYRTNSMVGKEGLELPSTLSQVLPSCTSALPVNGLKA